MYRVLCDGLPIYDLRDEELVLIDPKLTLEVNKAGSFEFKMPPNHPQYNLPVKMRSVIQVFQDDVEIFSGRPIEQKTDFYNRKFISCEGQLAYLNDSIQRPAEYHDKTVRGYLETLIENHNRQVKEVKVALKFNERCAGESENWDYLSIFYLKDGITYAALNRVRADSLAGQTVVLPSNDFYVYWHTDNSVNSYYGFSIDSIELTNAIALPGTVATLPKYTAVEAAAITDIQSAHTPYLNNSNLLWHYVYPLSADYFSSKMFKVGIVTVKDNNDSLYRYTNYNSTLQEIKEDLIDDLGGYIRIRNVNGYHYIDYIEEYDNTNNQTIQFGENLLDFSRNFDWTELVTAIIPLGAKLEESPIEALEQRLTIESVNNGCDYLTNEEALATYGWIVKTITWDGVKTPERLLSKGRKWLTDNQFEEMVIEAKAIDLHYTDGEIEQFKLGDKIKVHSSLHGIDRYFPLTKMTIQLNNLSANTITLGTTVKTSLTAKAISISSATQKMGEAIPVPSAIVKEAVDQATALITAATHGHVVTTAEEQLIMDTNDINTATKVWRWNLNGLGYSNTGYNGKYATAITMDGQIVGERLVANSVAAEKIDITYRSTVEKEIADAEEQARTDAEGYTDEALKSYYTKSQIETTIRNLEDSILLSAKETAVQYVDGKLKNYSTSAQIKVKTDAIESEVKKKLNSSELSTKIQQNAYAVKIAWNNISKYIQFESGELRIYDSANQNSDTLLMKMNYNGAWYYYKGITVGKIGTAGWANDEDFRGLMFGLNYGADYMTWGYQENANSNYIVSLTYYANEKHTNKGLHVTAPLYVFGNLRFNTDAGVYNYGTSGGVRLWANGGVDIGSSSTSCCKFTGYSFTVWNNKSIDFYSTLNLHGWGYTNDSDARMKKNIEETAVSGLSVINGIDLKSFDWVESGEHETIGIIAQQLLNVAPELVETCSDGHLQLKADKLVYYCIKAIQEMCANLNMGYSVPIWSDPYTLLEKKTFCAKLKNGKQVEKKPEITKPIIIPTKKG